MGQINKTSDSPLIEAWLTLQWELKRDDLLPIFRDEFYPIALGIFNEEVKSFFPLIKELSASKAPMNALQHIPRFQFWDKRENGLLQIGPGVASANILKNYTWEDLLKNCLFLREKLLRSYKESIKINYINLKYRYAIPFNYSKDDLQTFLERYLKTSVGLPKNVPGKSFKRKSISNMNLQFAFNLEEPKAEAVVTIATGGNKAKDEKTGQVKDTEDLIFELEVETKGPETPEIKNKKNFELWLNNSHELIHGWHRSFTDGERK